MGKTRRLQILLEPEQFARLEGVSEETGTPIAALIRNAVDRYYPGKSLTKAAAVNRLLEAAPVPMDDWDVEKDRMLSEMSRGG